MERRIRTFEDLSVWQHAIAFVKEIYLITAQDDFCRDFGMKDQIRRASVSIPTNIAEGFERNSRRQYLQFLNVAKGSAGEVRSLCRVAFEVGYIDLNTYNHLHQAVIVISRSLFRQIQAIKKAPPHNE